MLLRFCCCQSYYPRNQGKRALQFVVVLSFGDDANDANDEDERYTKNVAMPNVWQFFFGRTSSTDLYAAVFDLPISSKLIVAKIVKDEGKAQKKTKRRTGMSSRKQQSRVSC